MPGATTVLGLPFGLLTDQLTDLLDVSELAQGVDDALMAPGTGMFAAHACFAYRAVVDGNSSNLTNATYSTINHPSELIDTDGYHSPSSNSFKMTVPTGLAGYYVFGFSGRFVAAGSGRREGFMDINADGNPRCRWSVSNCDSGLYAGGGVGFAFLNDGDWLQVNYYQSSGGGLAVFQEGLTPNMWMYRLPLFA